MIAGSRLYGPPFNFQLGVAQTKVTSSRARIFTNHDTLSEMSMVPHEWTAQSSVDMLNSKQGKQLLVHSVELRLECGQ